MVGGGVEGGGSPILALLIRSTILFDFCVGTSLSDERAGGLEGGLGGVPGGVRRRLSESSSLCFAPGRAFGMGNLSFGVSDPLGMKGFLG